MEKRDLYLEKMEARLAQYSAKVVELRAKAAEAKVDMKLEYMNQMEVLEMKQAQVKEKYAQLKKSSEAAWDDMKEGTERAWKDLKESFDKASGRF